MKYLKVDQPSRWLSLSSIVIAWLILSVPVKTGSSSAIQKRALVIRHARVFDGERVIPQATVVVRDGKIISVGKSARIPAGAEVINGDGMTLLPGLIDSHTRTTEDRPTRKLLQQSLMVGVTTNLDMFTTNNQPVVELRREQNEGKTTYRADLFSAGIGISTSAKLIRHKESARSVVGQDDILTITHMFELAQSLIFRNFSEKRRFSWLRRSRRFIAVRQNSFPSSVGAAADTCRSYGAKGDFGLNTINIPPRWGEEREPPLKSKIEQR